MKRSQPKENFAKVAMDSTPTLDVFFEQSLFWKVAAQKRYTNYSHNFGLRGSLGTQEVFFQNDKTTKMRIIT